jgi:outer membrane protein assembly factor BamB
MDYLSRRHLIGLLGTQLIPAASMASEATAAPDPPKRPDTVAGIKAAVFLLEVRTDRHVRWGSAFFVSADGTAVTSRRLVKGANRLSALWKNRDLRPARVLKVDPVYDIAVIKVDLAAPAPTVTLGDSDVIHEGDRLALTAYPDPKDIVYLGMAIDSTTSVGSLNGVRYGGDANALLGDKVLQVDLPATRGMVGGPVYRMETGGVVGVLGMTVNDGPGLTFATPINQVRVLLSSLGVTPAEHAAKAGSPDAVTEPGDLRKLSVLSDTRELPAFFAYPWLTANPIDPRATAKAVDDWESATGQSPGRVTSIVNREGMFYYGAVDGSLRRVDMSDPVGDISPEVLLDVSDDRQIFLYPPIITDRMVCAVSGELNLTSEQRPGTDALSMVSSVIGIGSRNKEYITVVGTGSIFGIDKSSGEVAWQESTNFSATPSIYNGRLFYGGVGERGCLDADHGGRVAFGDKPRYGHETDGYDYIQPPGDKPNWNHVSAGKVGLFTLVVPMEVEKTDGRLRLSGRGKALVRSHDLTTGEGRWMQELGDVAGRPQPMGTALFVDDQNGVIYALAAQIVAALDAKTGSVRWILDQGKTGKPAAQRRGSGPILGQSRFTPGILAHEGTVYVGSTDRKLHAINGGNGTELWAFPTRGSVGSPVLLGDRILFGSTDGFLYCVNARKGDLAWRLDTGSPIRSQPISYRGMIYVPAENGTIFAVRLPAV